jgi:hypothetical protein
MEFHFETVEITEINNLLPAGEYTCICESAEVQQTKAGTGQFLNCAFQIIEGQLKGRKFFERFTLENPNSDAVRIGHEQLTRLCKALGMSRLTATEQLLDKPVKVKLGVKQRKDTGEDQQVVKSYSAVAQQAAPQPVAQSGYKPGTKPW